MRRLLPLLLMLLLLGACARGPESPGISGGAEPPAADAAQAEAPAADATQGAPPAEPSQRIVTADWSRLETPETLSAPGRWYDGYTDRLIPRDDYGPLLPYAGLRLADEWPAGHGCLYGLMTADGRVVTDPVFTNVYRLGRYNLVETLPLMALEQPDPDAAPDDYDPRIYALAAADGSWCTDFDIVGIIASHASVQLFLQDGVQLLDTAGKPLRSWTVP